MNRGQSVFSQIMQFLPKPEFRKCVQRYRGHYKVQSFSCLDQFLCMAFAQLTYRESLRDIEACLRSVSHQLYHMGIRSRVARNTLAHANENRDWRIYADLAVVLIARARDLYRQDAFAVDLQETVYALDASTVDLCLALFPWARFRQEKGAVRLHTLLDLRGNIPSFIHITDGKVHEVNVLDLLPPEPGSIYLMDRGYLDFDRLFHWHRHHAYFITRLKTNTRFERVYSHPVDKKGSGLRCDQTIQLTAPTSRAAYPERLRRVGYVDPATGRRYDFLTNHFDLPALTVADLFRCRWQVELFFKWVKQHLRIKTFYGTSENAVKTQIWIAVSVYVLVAILKKELRLEPSLYNLLQVLSLTLFEKTPIPHLFADPEPVFPSPASRDPFPLFNGLEDNDCFF